MCGKTAFLTMAEAERALRGIWRNGRSTRAWTAKLPLRAYECPQCRCFHLTSQPLMAMAPH